ncbi:MAG: hypothetical protein K2X93_00095 [Candidatus Obscuribacterales bacterium]|nr:hypothetical protein [Candidatus Obscuribacterales bacterium]
MAINKGGRMFIELKDNGKQSRVINTVQIVGFYATNDGKQSHVQLGDGSRLTVNFPYEGLKTVLSHYQETEEIPHILCGNVTKSDVEAVGKQETLLGEPVTVS